MIITAPETNYAKGQPQVELPRSFFEGRFKPTVHPESIDWEQWWDEQERRCLHGWSDGGFRVSGAYYYHLNFKQINLINEFGNQDWDHPYFAYEDQEVFNDFNESFAEGKGICLITGRGFGKSFDVATIAEHKFIFYKASEIIVSASTSKFANRLWHKIDVGFNSVHDEFRPNLLKEKEGEWESGYQEKIGNRKKTYGYRSKLQKIVYGDDPGATRGARPDIQIFEEIGSWSGSAKLKQCWKKTEPSWWRGSKRTCLPILIGTGGEMDTGASEDAQDFAMNGDKYGLKTFIYDSPDGEKRKGGCKFFPAYQKFGGYYETSGRTTVQGGDESKFPLGGSKPFLENRRESKKSDPELFRQECAEFPFFLEEAFYVSGSGVLPREQLEERLFYIQRNEDVENRVVEGYFRPVKNKGVVVDVRFVQQKGGPVSILEHPKTIKDDLQGEVIPPNLYVSGCDSYDSVEEEGDENQEISEGSGKSKGAHFVYKRWWKPSEELQDTFIAKLTMRGRALRFYEQTYYMNMYYNCKMLYEHTKIGIAQWYITNKLHKYLYKRPVLDQVGVIKKFTSTNRYGIAMPSKVKQHAIMNYGEWIRDNVDNMFFVSQIKDGMSFRFGDSRFDETMAASITLMANDDMHDVRIIETVKQNYGVFPKFERDARGNLHFS